MIRMIAQNMSDLQWRRILSGSGQSGRMVTLVEFLSAAVLVLTAVSFAQIPGLLTTHSSKSIFVCGTASACGLAAVGLATFSSLKLRSTRNTRRPKASDRPGPSSSERFTAILDGTSVWSVVLALAIAVAAGIWAGVVAEQVGGNPPSGVFSNPIAKVSPSLAGDSGLYLFGLKNVKHSGNDLIWFELQVPQYYTRYARNFLYYYTQASQDPKRVGNYSAAVEMENIARTNVRDVIAAFACPAGDSRVNPGGKSPDRETAGCSLLDYICVAMPACDRKDLNCQKAIDRFSDPDTCQGRRVHAAQRVTSVP
jgi:hypothetical protein